MNGVVYHGSPDLRSARRLARPATRLALICYARGIPAPVLAAVSGVPAPVLAEMIAGGPPVADMEITPYLAVARALGLPVAVLLTDPCPACCATERSLTGDCPACGAGAQAGGPAA
jgi:hypothetical protein